MISGLNDDELEYKDTVMVENYSQPYTSVIDKTTEIVNKQEVKNKQYEERMKMITKIASSAKNHSIRNEKKLNRYNEYRMKDIKRMQIEYDKCINRLCTKHTDLADDVYCLQEQVLHNQCKLDKFMDEQEHKNKKTNLFVLLLIIYTIMLGYSFHLYNGITEYRNPTEIEKDYIMDNSDYGIPEK